MYSSTAQHPPGCFPASVILDEVYLFAPMSLLCDLFREPTMSYVILKDGFKFLCVFPCGLGLAGLVKDVIRLRRQEPRS